jgi:hypothetical protein
VSPRSEGPSNEGRSYLSTGTGTGPVPVPVPVPAPVPVVLPSPEDTRAQRLVQVSRRCEVSSVVPPPALLVKEEPSSV